MGNNDQPLLSLIIPVYNTEEYVQKCLDSIYEQTYKNIEIIIVNNGSSGNINDIVYSYRKLYPDRTLKLVIHEKNIGTFHGRGSGMKVAEGDYFTFMDADDRIGVDYFYQMISHAEKTNSEIVVTDLVHEDENKHAFRYVVDPVRSLDFEIEGTEEIFDFYYSYAGRSYSMYGIWNKIYKRTLWDRCKPLIDAITEQFALCEDAEYTTIFFSQAKKVSNIHNQYYYHYIYSGSASAGLASSYEKAERSIKFQGAAFRNMKEHLKRTGLYEQYRENFEIFRGFHQKCMLWHIDNSNLKAGQKAYLTKYCNDEFEQNKPGELSQTDMFFTQHFVTQTNELEEIREKIISDKYKVVSFDVFDTAIVRMTWQPIDVFEFMTPFFKMLTGRNHSFANIRISSEKYAREKLMLAGGFYEDVTLDEIYANMCEFYNVDTAVAEKLKEHEIETEMYLCSQRCIVKELYGLALRSGKKVIFASDMYLPAEVVEKILQKNGYDRYEKLYISSEMRVTKASGNMYKEIMSDLAGYKPEEFLHIGDNYNTDIGMAGKMKWETAYLAKTVDVFCNFSANTYAGKLFEELYSGPYFAKFSSSLFLRTSIAIASNLVFDNPFVQYREDSDFNGDPYHIGVQAVGMYVYGFCRWLADEMTNKGQTKITFIGEEMELFYSAFSYICELEKRGICTDYIEILNTKISIPRIFTKDDLYTIPSAIEISCITPNDLCKALEYCLKEEFLEKQDSILKIHGIVPTKKFTTYTQIKAVLDLLHDECFDEKKITTSGKTLPLGSVCAISGLNLDVNSELNNNRTVEEVYSLYNPAIFNWVKMTRFCEESIDGSYREIFFRFFCDPDKQNVGGKSILKVVRKGVFDYILNFSKVYLYCDMNPAQIEQMSEPMSYLIRHGKFIDRYIFATMEFDEDISVSDFWGMYAKPNHLDVVYSDVMVYARLNKFQKLCYMLVVDHNRLKEAVKARLKKYPHLFSAAKRVYRTLRPVK